MKDYILFIDTETSCLPKNWNSAYEEEGKWPYSIQVSWQVYNHSGELIKEEDHYLNDEEISIASSAIKIHGITRDLLNKKGEPRKKVLQLLADDVNKYQPLVVGHFMELDMHMLSADFYRASIENPIVPQETFCTMLATKYLATNPQAPYLKLSQLNRYLFDKKLEKVHNAYEDAKATAACFFELVKRGIITDEVIIKQQAEILKRSQPSNRFGCLPLILFISLVILSYMSL